MTYGHLWADCLYTGISSGPNARYRVWEAFTFTFFTRALIIAVYQLNLGWPVPHGFFFHLFCKRIFGMVCFYGLDILRVTQLVKALAET